MKKEEIRNKNIEEEQEEKMNIFKKVVMGIREYFKETYSDHVFRKVVSLLVVACFVLNIANLPAYAKSEKRAKDNKEKNEQVIESGKTDTSEIGLVTSEEAMRTGSGEGVGTMNAIGNMSEEEVDSIIEIDEKAGVIKDKSKGNKVVAVYNADKEQVLGYAGQSDIVYYQALVNRKKALEKGEVSAPRKIEKLGDNGAQEGIKTEKTAEEIAEVKGTVIGEYKPEVTKEEENQEGNIISGIEEENKENIEIAKEEGTSVVIGLPEQKEEEVIARAEDEKSEGIEESQEYGEVVSELAKQSGVSEEEVKEGLEEALAGKTEEEKEGIIGLLASFFEEGGDIINCAVDALGEMLNIASKGVLGLQALLVEISTGLFEKNNADLINAGESQLMTSMETMRTILAEYGRDAIGLASDIDTFMEGLKVGESAIVWVNGDHYITVSKLENGNFTISDPNVRNGEKVEYSAEGLKDVLSGKAGKDIDGNEVGISYKAEGEDGRIRVLSDSEGLKEQVEQGKAQEISKEEMIDIVGAKTVTKTVTRTVTVEKTKTVTVEKTRTVTKTREESYEVTHTDENGKTYTTTETRTVEYEEEETYTEEEEVTYTEEEEVTETITEEVPDETDEAEWGTQKEEEWNKQFDDITDPETGKIKGDELDKVLEGKDVKTKVLSSDEGERTQEGIDKCNERLAKIDDMSDEEFIAAMKSGDINVVKSEVKKVNGISVDGEQLDQSFVDEVNKSIGKGIEVGQGQTGVPTELNNAINMTAINVLAKGNNKENAKTDAANKLVSNGIEINGVSIDRTKGMMSFTDENGNKVTAQFNNMSDKQYGQMLSYVANNGGESGLNYMKTQKNEEKETVFKSAVGKDDQGRTYKEESADRNARASNTGATIKTYYTDDSMTEVDHRELNLETYNKDMNVSTQQRFNITEDANAENTVIGLDDGSTVTIPGGRIDQSKASITTTEYNKDGTKARQYDMSIDDDGTMHLTKTEYDKDGGKNITKIDATEDQFTDKQKKGGSGGKGGSDILGEFTKQFNKVRYGGNGVAKVNSLAVNYKDGHSEKVKLGDSVYKGYENIKKIDLSKASVYTETADGNKSYQYNKGDVRVTISDPNSLKLGTNGQVEVSNGANAIVEQQIDGTTYKAVATVDSDKNITVNEQTMQSSREYDGVTVTTRENIKFDGKSFSGGDFTSNPEQNVATLKDGTQITGVTVEFDKNGKGTVTYSDGAKVEQYGENGEKHY